MQINKCNNTYHSPIKIKTIHVKSSTYIDFDIGNKDKEPKFRVGDHVRISKYKDLFTKAMFVIVQKKCLWLRKLKILSGGPEREIIEKNREEIAETFYKKELQKTNQCLELKK